MIHVYRHRTLDSHNVFYVGIGSLERSQSKKGRNQLWKRIANKHGFYSEIIHSCESREEAGELEMLLISEYGRLNTKTGILCNMTIGGDGVIGLSDESKKSISEKLKKYYKENPVKNRVISEEHKKKLSISQSKRTGDKNSFYGKKHSDEAKLKVSMANKGRKHSEEVRQKISEASKRMWEERNKSKK